MIKLWRPASTDWGNRWPAEEELNELVAAGWRILAVLPPCDYTSHPTVVLKNSERWRPRNWVPWYRYWWWRFKMWWAGVRGPAQP